MPPTLPQAAAGCPWPEQAPSQEALASPLQTCAGGFPAVVPSPRGMLVLSGPEECPFTWGECTTASQIPPLPCGFPVLLEGPDSFTQQPHGGQRLLPTHVHEALPREGGGGVWGKHLLGASVGTAPVLTGCFPFHEIPPATAVFPLQWSCTHPIHAGGTCPSPAAPSGEPRSAAPHLPCTKGVQTHHGHLGLPSRDGCKDAG